MKDGKPITTYRSHSFLHFITTLLWLVIVICLPQIVNSVEILEMRGQIFVELDEEYAMEGTEDQEGQEQTEIDREQEPFDQETLYQEETEPEYDFENNPSPYQVGLIIGTNITTVSEDTAGFKANADIGFRFNWNFHKYFSAFAGLSHLIKSFEFKSRSDIYLTNRGVISMEYLVLTCGAVFRYPFEFYAPYLFTGLDVNFLIASEAHSYNAQYTFRTDGITRPVTLGAFVGIGFSLDIGFGEVFGEFFYNGGLTAAAAQSKTNPYFSNFEKSVTHDIILLVGYKVGIELLFGEQTQLDEED